MSEVALLDIVIKTNQLEQAVNKLNEMQKAGAGAERTQKSLGSASSVLAGTMGGLAAQIGSVVAVSAAFNRSIQQFAAFDSGMIGVRKTTGLAGAELQTFGKEIAEMSKRIPNTAAELLSISQSAGQLGVNGSKNLLKFTETIAKLGSASDLAGEEAATTLARLLTVTKENVDGVDVLGSVIVRLGNNVAATESEIASMAMEIAQATSAYKVSSAETVALGAAMRSMGMRAELSGSAVGRTFRMIEEYANSGGDKLSRLAKITGLAADEISSRFKNDPVKVFQAFIEGLGRVVDSGGSATKALDQFGLRGEEILKVLPTLAVNSVKVSESLSMMSSELKNATALNNEAAAASDAYEKKMAMLGNRIDAVARGYGSVLAPAMLSGKEALADVAEAFDVTNIAQYSAGIQAAAVGFGVLAVSSQVAKSEAVQLISALGTGRAMLLTSERAALGAAQGAYALAVSERVAAEAAVHRVWAQAAEATSSAEAMATSRALAVANNQLALANQRVAATELEVAAARTASARSSMVLSRFSGGFAAAKTAVGGFVTALGGPLVVGLGTAAAALMYVSSKQDEAEKTAQRYRDVLLGVGQQAEATTGKLSGMASAVKQAQSDMAQADADAKKDIFNQYVSRIKDWSGIGSNADMATEFNLSTFSESDFEPKRKDVSDLVGEFRSGTVTLDEFYSKLRDIPGTDGLVKLTQAALGAHRELEIASKKADGLAKAVKPDVEVVTTTGYSDSQLDAIESMRVKLAGYNDTATDGAARVAALRKEQIQLVKAVGDGHPYVSQMAKVVAYANEHYGKTPAEVAKATRAVNENVLSIQSEISALESSKDAYGNINQQRYSQAMAAAKAEAEYTQQILNGADKVVAARERDLKVQLSQIQAGQQNLQLARDFYSQYADMFNDPAMKADAIGREMSVYGNVDGIDKAMIEKMKARKLLEAKLRPLEQSAQARVEYADLTNDAKAYYEAQVNLLSIQKELELNEEKRLVFAAKLAKVQAQANGDFIYAAKDALAAYQRTATDTFSQVQNVVTSSMQSMEDAIVQFAMTGKMSFSDFANSVIEDMARITVRQSITGQLAGAFSGWLGDLFAGTSSASNLTGSTPGAGATAGELSHYFSANAKGNVYSSPGLSAYSGQIVDRPTIFPFAKGIGLMGEAGPEAILPLTRTAGGNLGVRAEGGGTDVIIHNYSNQPAKVHESRDDRGRRRVEVVIGEMVGAEVNRAGSAAHNSVRGSFGLRPSLTRR